MSPPSDMAKRRVGTSTRCVLFAMFRMKAASMVISSPQEGLRGPFQWYTAMSETMSLAAVT